MNTMSEIPRELADAEVVALVLPFGERVSAFHEDAPKKYEWGDVPLPRQPVPLRAKHDGREVGLLHSFVLDRTGIWAAVKPGLTASKLIADGVTELSAELDDGKLTGAALVTDGRPAFASAQIFVRETARASFTSGTAIAVRPPSQQRSAMDLGEHRLELLASSMQAVHADVDGARRQFEARQLELAQQDDVDEELRLLAAGLPVPMWPPHLPKRRQWDALQARAVADAGASAAAEFADRTTRLEAEAERERRPWWRRIVR